MLRPCAGLCLSALILAGCPDKVAAKAFNSCMWGTKAFQKLEMVEAMSEFNGALEAKPNYSGAMIGRAMVDDAKSDFDAAMKDLNRALELSPKSPQVLMMRSCIYMRMGNETAAAADEAAARAIAPTLSATNRCDKTWLWELKWDFCQVKGGK